MRSRKMLSCARLRCEWCTRPRRTLCKIMASYLEAQLAGRLACVARGMRYTSSRMACDGVNERLPGVRKVTDLALKVTDLEH